MNIIFYSQLAYILIKLYQTNDMVNNKNDKYEQLSSTANQDTFQSNYIRLKIKQLYSILFILV
jgi:hypothetical protein